MKTASKFPRAKPHRLSVAEVKALVRYRDGYRCTECGMTSKEHRLKYHRTLDVHRLVPGSRYTIKGCVALCTRCHQAEHAGREDSRRADEPPHRYELRLDPELLERTQRQADRRGLSVAAYIRQALSMQLEADEATDPSADN